MSSDVNALPPALVFEHTTALLGELLGVHAPILRLPADIGAHMNHSLAVLRFAFSCLLADLTRNYRKARP